MSLKAIWNNITESGDPCGIPFTRETILDSWPLIVTLQRMFYKKDLIKLNIFGPIV